MWFGYDFSTPQFMRKYDSQCSSTGDGVFKWHLEHERSNHLKVFMEFLPAWVIVRLCGYNVNPEHSFDYLEYEIFLIITSISCLP